jgi:general stress protein 26
MLGTTRPNRSPHMMPVWGVLMDNVFYFSSGEKSRKARNLRSNPKCVVSIENQDNKEAIILEGAAEKVSEKTLAKRFKEAYQAKYKYDMSAFNEPIYAVRPRVVFAFSAYGDFGGTATRWKFTSN